MKMHSFGLHNGFTNAESLRVGCLHLRGGASAATPCGQGLREPSRLRRRPRLRPGPAALAVASG